MKRHTLAAIGMVCLALARGAFAADVAVYQAGDRVDPRAIAAILSRTAVPTGVKMRSIRLLPESNAAQPAAEIAKETAAPAAPVVTSAPAAPEARVVTASLESTPIARPESFSLPVPFAFDSTRILPESVGQLEAVVEGIKLAGPDVQVMIEGHTDATGTDAYNVVLSYRRAEAVKAYLVSRGIDPSRLRVAGMGRSTPLNASDPYAAENRRVQFRPLSEGERLASAKSGRG